MKFEDWKAGILELNEYEERERKRVQDETLPKRLELLKVVERRWLCEATGAVVYTNGTGLIDGGAAHTWLIKGDDKQYLWQFDHLEPEELELLAKVKRALNAWQKGEADDIVVDAPSVQLGE